MPDRSRLQALVATILAAVFVPLAPFAGPLSAGGACGDGTIDVGEPCDDGDAQDLDGCTRACLYEHVHRFAALAIEGGAAPAACTPPTNAFGGAFSAAGRAAVNDQLAAALDAGTLNVLLDLLDLEDPEGLDDPTLEVGLLAAAPDPRGPGPVPAVDGWFLAAAAGLDADGRPAQVLPDGVLVAGELTAGPGDFDLAFLDGSLRLLAARAAATAGAVTSLPAPPPLALAAGFAAFESLAGTGSGRGLCGNVTVGSMAQLPVPPELTTGGTACQACTGSRVYVACPPGQPVDATCHSLLDVLVGGCRTFSCLVNVITPTQPDVGVGANPPNDLVFAPSGGGIDKVAVVEPDDAYSSWMTFTSERVHATNNFGVVFEDGFESGDTAAWSDSVSP